MSKLETNTIDNISGSSTLTIGDSNASTISIPKNITLGASGTTITVPSGATITNNGTQTGFGGTNTPAFSAGLSGNQSCANGANTIVAFANEIIDTNNAFNNSTYTFTVPSGEAGNYYVFAQARKDNFNTESRFLLEVIKNNSTAGEIALVLGENGGTGTSSYQVAICSILAPLSVGDTLLCKVYHNSGSTEFIRPDGTYFGAYKIIE